MSDWHASLEKAKSSGYIQTDTDRYILIMLSPNRRRKRMVPTVCSSCNLTIHPNFVGHHKCGYGNCPVCKTPVTKSEYWSHIKTHPGHENDNPPQPKTTR